MPLTAKGNTIMDALQKQYGDEKGKSVFYAMRETGQITGVDAAEDLDSNFASRLDAVLEKTSELAARTDRACERLDEMVVHHAGRRDSQPRHFRTARWSKR